MVINALNSANTLLETILWGHVEYCFQYLDSIFTRLLHEILIDNVQGLDKQDYFIGANCTEVPSNARAFRAPPGKRRSSNGFQKTARMSFFFIEVEINSLA